MKMFLYRGLLAGLILLFGISGLVFSQNADPENEKLWKKIDNRIAQSMEKGLIPGLSLLVVDGDKQVIKNYGYADLSSKKKVTSKTLYEIGSCTKAFTALAALKLADDNKLNLDEYVSKYLPWFEVKYNDSIVNITVRQLLQHTSGIPWITVARIPITEADDALEKTVMTLKGQKLKELPGKKFEYATINYDVVALIIQKIVGQDFENYLQDSIIDVLNLKHTSVGKPKNPENMAQGYKISFSRLYEYEPPVFRGNYAAGYVISNIEDMAHWIKIQMGMVDHDLSALIQRSQRRDVTVPLHGMSSYAYGWQVSLNGKGEIYHGGANPTFITDIKMRPEKQLAVVVLSNSNSDYASVIAENVMRDIAGEKLLKNVEVGDFNDKIFSIFSIMLALYVVIVLVFFVFVVIGIIKHNRSFQSLSGALIRKFLLSVLYILPFLLAIYIYPKALGDSTWAFMWVWLPYSLQVLIGLLLGAIFISYLVFFVSICFPTKDKYRKQAPQIILLSILSGLANVALIVMVTSSLHSDMETIYLVFYFVLVLGVYLLGRKYVEINLIKVTRGMVYDLKVKLIEKIFSTSYQRFEGMDRGRIYTALSGDAEVIGESTNTFVMLITSLITIFGAFFYLATMAIWVAVITIALIVVLSILYYFVSQSTNIYFEEARDEQNIFMRLVNGMIDGFKELSLQLNKKLQYKGDLTSSADKLKRKRSTADIRFVSAFLLGESLLLLLLGTLAFGIPKMFPGIALYIVTNFIVLLLYLIGPINAVLGAVPTLLNLRVSWKRLQQFLEDIPSNMNVNDTPVLKEAVVSSFKAEGIIFRYEGKDDVNNFEIGPIDLEVNSGEILFIIGGNGSGKTTLAKILTGLYQPVEGKLMINGKELANYELSEYFSVVFSPSYLFEKLYNIDYQAKRESADKYLEILQLTDKVHIQDNTYSTIKLSGGQRKRLALLQCYLEDSPIYLFDEWAADQDPHYRNFFYRTLLPEMKRSGKIIIAITHDDHYFDVADKVVKMNRGKLENFSGDLKFTFTSSEVASDH